MTSSSNSEININIPLSVLTDLNKALNDSTNALSDNTKALTDLKTDRDNLLKQNDKLSKQMKEMKNEFEDLKQKFMIHSCTTRKRKLNEDQSSQLCEKKAKKHICASLNALSSDTLSDILQFVGRRCYGSFGLINRTCNKIYTKNAMAKETFIFGYAKFSMILHRRFDHANYDNLAIGVVKYNRVDILGYLIRRSNGEKLSHVCQIAALEGRLDILKEIFDNVNYVVLKYLHECPEICEKAAKGNSFKLLKWLREQGSCWNEEAFYAAACCGNVKTIQWMIARDPDQFSFDPDENDIEYDEFEALYEYDEKMHELFGNAAQSANLEMIKWLKQTEFGREYYPTEYIFDRAVEGGSLEVVKYFLDEDCPCDEDTVCGTAAAENHLQLLKYLRDHGFDLNYETFRDAVYSDNVEILEWLKENKCPWDAVAIERARRSNKKRALRWLLENGCPRLSPRVPNPL